jgi:hypothetical protein
LNLYKLSPEKVYTSTNDISSQVNIQAIEVCIDELSEKIRRMKLRHDELHARTCTHPGQQKLKRMHGRIVVEYDNKSRRAEVHFRTVERHIGQEIQNHLHYIGQDRADTQYEFGLFHKDAEVPLAYAAFSDLDRTYLLSTEYLQRIGGKLLVMTRAYGFHNQPKNSMSLLYRECSNHFRKNSKYNAIVTAINLNLPFQAASFRGASYYPFATSPMMFQYIDGEYSTRRRLVQEFGTDHPERLQMESRYSEAKMPVIPILWLIKGVSRKTTRMIDQDFTMGTVPIYPITTGEYQRH